MLTKLKASFSLVPKSDFIRNIAIATIFFIALLIPHNYIQDTNSITNEIPMVFLSKDLFITTAKDSASLFYVTDNIKKNLFQLGPYFDYYTINQNSASYIDTIKPSKIKNIYAIKLPFLIKKYILNNNEIYNDLNTTYKIEYNDKSIRIIKNIKHQLFKPEATITDVTIGLLIDPGDLLLTDKAEYYTKSSETSIDYIESILGTNGTYLTSDRFKDVSKITVIKHNAPIKIIYTLSKPADIFVDKQYNVLVLKSETMTDIAQVHKNGLQHYIDLKIETK